MHGDRHYIQNIRRDYLKHGLNEEDLDEDPVKQFSKWFFQAINEKLVDGNAMTLCTVSNGRPNARIVLLKSFDEEGFVFFTNYESKKARELDENPLASMVFYWGEQERQVKIQGSVQRVTREESAEYFSTRPRESQIGAWSSKQSKALSGRKELEDRYKEINDKYAGQEVPLPEFWGGYRLKPDYFEFWQGRPNRLHDRFGYEKEDDHWKIRRLYP